MDWSEFRDRLQATLRQLTDRCLLIVAAPGNGGYVQFSVSEDGLNAEAAGPGFVDGAAAHAPDDPRMLAVGWVPPTRAQPNWSAEMQLPALTSEVSALAAGCVVALREVFHASEPGVLTYQAWREPEVQPWGVTWPAERFEQLDPGQNPMPLPGLGLELVAR